MRCMEVTARHVEDIPRGNLRVQQAEFVALWRVTEHLMEANRGDWYVTGVAMTCRWLACAAVPSVLGGWELAWAPVTQRAARQPPTAGQRGEPKGSVQAMIMPSAVSGTSMLPELGRNSQIGRASCRER